MRILAAVAVIASLLEVQAPPAQPQTPQQCVEAGQEFAAKKRREVGRMNAAIDAERVAIVKTCGANLDLDRAAPGELAAFVEFYLASQQLTLAEQALARGLAADTPVTVRADLLVLGVRMLLRQPKSDARDAQAEHYVAMLDTLPDDVRDQKTYAHGALNGYYRAGDIDSGIIRHSTWLIENGRTMTPEQRKTWGTWLIDAYENLAEALAGQGQNDNAIDVLKRAAVDLPDVADVTARTKDPLARYLLVGTPAPAIEAPVWLNRESMTPLDLKGKVTLLQFTAHWCGPCKDSYPAMQRLRGRFKNQPFQVVFVTRTYGYFETERDLTREREIARDTTYFAGYGFDIPIAIGPAMTSMVDGKRVAFDDPVEKGFGVSGIPQIDVIDAKGRIRLIMIGYDEANEEKLASFIEKVLREK